MESDTLDDGSARGKRLLEEAERELERAVQFGSDGQAKYWLGRKRGIEDALNTHGNV